MRTYRLFKTIDNYKCEDYLHHVTNTRHRIAPTKLQLSNHKLAIETGRYLRPFKNPAGRISPICKIDNNFIDFIFDKKISVPKQSIQWQMKQSKKLRKKERNNNYILNIIIKEKLEMEDEYHFLNICPAYQEKRCSLLDYLEKEYRIKISRMSTEKIFNHVSNEPRA